MHFIFALSSLTVASPYLNIVMESYSARLRRVSSTAHRAVAQKDARSSGAP
jgi:hypothetical protein